MVRAIIDSTMRREQKDFIRTTVRGKRYVSTEGCINTSISILCKGKKRAEDLLEAFNSASRDYWLCVAAINSAIDAIASLTRIKESLRQQKETAKQPKL